MSFNSRESIKGIELSQKLTHFTLITFIYTLKMLRVVAVAIACLLGSSHAAVVKKDARPNVPMSELARLQGMEGMPNLSQMMQNFNGGAQSANRDAAKMIDEYNKMMQQRLEEMNREMMKQMNAYGLNPELVNSKRSRGKAADLERSVEGPPAGTPNFPEGIPDFSAMMGAMNAGSLPDSPAMVGAGNAEGMPDFSAMMGAGNTAGMPDFSQVFGQNGDFGKMMDGLNEMMANIAKLSGEMTANLNQYGIRPEDMKH